MKSAPELFRGDHSQIRTFLDHYERLCALHNVVDDQEKVDSILCYCSTRVQEIIEGMTHFHLPNWYELKNNLLKHFDADLSNERFYEKDLKNFVTSARRAPILSLHDFRAYNRHFIRIGGWLRNKGKITEEDYNRHFWAGLPPSFHLNVDSHLILKDPDLDVSIPYSYSDVCKAAEELLHRDRFDAEYLERLGVEEKENIPLPRSDPRSDPVRPLLSLQDARTTLQGLDKAGTTAQKQDEVENLIKKMSQTTLSDPNYICALLLSCDQAGP